MSDDDQNDYSGDEDDVIEIIPPDDITEYYGRAPDLLKRSTSYLLQSSGESVVALAPYNGVERPMVAISGTPSELGQLFNIGFDVVAYNFGIVWPQEFIAQYVASMPESGQRNVIRRIKEINGVDD